MVRGFLSFSPRAASRIAQQCLPPGSGDVLLQSRRLPMFRQEAAASDRKAYLPWVRERRCPLHASWSEGEVVRARRLRLRGELCSVL